MRDSIVIFIYSKSVEHESGLKDTNLNGESCTISAEREKRLLLAKRLIKEIKEHVGIYDERREGSKILRLRRLPTLLNTSIARNRLL